jgi:DNA-binding NarL/FixJ family response regulator
MPEAAKPNQVDISILLGYIATKDLPTTEKKVAVLARLGFSNTQMAVICATSENVIKTLKSKVKKG